MIIKKFLNSVFFSTATNSEVLACRKKNKIALIERIKDRISKEENNNVWGRLKRTPISSVGSVLGKIQSL